MQLVSHRIFCSQDIVQLQIWIWYFIVFCPSQLSFPRFYAIENYKLSAIRRKKNLHISTDQNLWFLLFGFFKNFMAQFKIIALQKFRYQNQNSPEERNKKQAR